MSPLLNLDMSFDDAKVEGEKQKLKLSPGAYKLLCKNAEAVESKKKNPMIKWTFEVVENQNPDFNGKQLYMWSSLPHNGKFGGIGFLVDVTTALGTPWSGTQINTDDYITKTCMANVAYEDGSDFPNIKSFI